MTLTEDIKPVKGLMNPVQTRSLLVVIWGKCVLIWDECKGFFLIFCSFFSRGTSQRKALHKRHLTKNPGDQRESETNFFNAKPVNFNAKSKNGRLKMED
jgi:hypothetical protein